MAEVMTMCPSCERRDMTQGVRLVNRGDDGCTVEASPPCDLCGGAGEITDDRAECYRLGRSFRRARVDLGFTLMDCTNWWGESPAVWSKAERYGIGPASVLGRMSAYLLWEGDPPERRVRERIAHYEALARRATDPDGGESAPGEG